MARVRFAAVLATTHVLAERGVAISREALEQMAALDQQSGGPIYREHGTELIGQWIKKEVRQREDGHFELVGEGEIELAEGETVEDLTRKAWSIGVLEDSGDRPDNAAAILGIDALAFKEVGRKGAADQLGEARDVVAVDWYHQFSALPDPALVISLTPNILPFIVGVAQSAVWDGLKLAIIKLVGRASERAEFVTFRMRGQGVAIDAKIPTSAEESVEVIDALFEGAARVIRASAHGGDDALPPPPT